MFSKNKFLEIIRILILLFINLTRHLFERLIENCISISHRKRNKFLLLEQETIFFRFSILFSLHEIKISRRRQFYLYRNLKFIKPNLIILRDYTNNLFPFFNLSFNPFLNERETKSFIFESCVESLLGETNGPATSRDGSRIMAGNDIPRGRRRICKSGGRRWGREEEGIKSNFSCGINGCRVIFISPLLLTRVSRPRREPFPILLPRHQNS